MFIELGRFARDVEVRKVTINGEEKSVFNNALAVSYDKNNAAFMEVTAWNGTADLIGKYFQKGDELVIEGELRNRKNKREDGKEFTEPFIMINRVRFTHGKKAAAAENSDNAQE